MMTFSRVVIDADQLLYSCGFVTDDEPPSHMFKLIKTALNKIIRDTKAEAYTVLIAGKGNFREDICFDYKANRKKEKPVHYEAGRQYLIDNWDARQCDRMEADDVASIELFTDYLENKGVEEDCTVILSSPDKDLNNTPGWHYNPRTRETYWVSAGQAHRHFFYQLLMGDAVDNIKGLPYCTPDVIEEYGLSHMAKRGCGKGSAKLIMKADVDGYVGNVVKCYISWGMSEGQTWEDTYEYMNEQAQLLWMVREYDELGDPLMFNMDKVEFKEMWKEAEDEEEV